MGVATFGRSAFQAVRSESFVEVRAVMVIAVGITSEEVRPVRR